MKQYEELWKPAQDPSQLQTSRCVNACTHSTYGKLFPAILHTVFALASLFENAPLAENAKGADAYFSRTQKLDLLGVLDHEVETELIQLGLLMAYYLQSTERFAKCWNITGLTIRMAQNMGLHLSIPDARRRGFISSKALQLECEMRLRAWHGCVILDR